MKVLMQDNLIEKYNKVLPGELLHQERAMETINFLKSIEGKKINIRFTNGDAFEEEDDNIWLPNSLWEKI